MNRYTTRHVKLTNKSIRHAVEIQFKKGEGGERGEGRGQRGEGGDQVSLIASGGMTVSA